MIFTYFSEKQIADQQLPSIEFDTTQPGTQKKNIEE